MSLFLRFVSGKCPRRTISCVKRFYWTSHSFKFSEGLGIRYFIPRTTDTPVVNQRDQVKDWYSVPEEFKVIYNLSHENALKAVSHSVLGFAVLFIYLLFHPEHFVEFSENYKEEKEPVPEEPVLQDDYTPSAVMEKMKTLPDSVLETVRSGDPRLKLVAALTMIIFFWYLRSKCVLTIYRHNDDFITVFYQALGFKKKLIEHKATDCCYYPKRKLFNYNLMGKNVIIFPEFFVHPEEEQVYIGRRSQ